MTTAEPAQNQLRQHHQHRQPEQLPASAPAPAPALTQIAAQTRTGKVARLPHAIREELNRRLQDGESAATLLPWLNSHPAVQEVLAAQFAARPLNAENLSQWRHGGYQDWLHHQEDLALARSLLHESTALSGDASPGDDVPGNAPAGIPLSDRLSALAALALARVIRTLSRSESIASPETLKPLLQAIRTLNTLRAADHRAARLKMDLLRWEKEQESSVEDALATSLREALTAFSNGSPEPECGAPVPGTSSTEAPIINHKSSIINVPEAPESGPIKPDQTRSNLPSPAPSGPTATVSPSASPPPPMPQP